MNRKFLISIFLILNFGIIVFAYYQIKKNNTNILNYESLNTKRKIEYENLKNKYFLEIKNNFSQISPNTKIVTIQGDTLLMKKIITNRPKFVFSFSKYTCSACIEREIIRIKKLKQKIKNEEIIFLTNYEHIRDVVMFCKQNDIAYTIYMISDGVLNSLYKTNLAHYFILYNDFYIRDIYFVDTNNLDLTNKYFEIILSKYF